MVISQIRHSGGLGHEIWYIAFAPFENLAKLGLKGIKLYEDINKTRTINPFSPRYARFSKGANAIYKIS